MHLENAARTGLSSKKQVRNVTEIKTQPQTDAVEPEQEQDVDIQPTPTSEKNEERSVISSDVSPHDSSDFDFLQMNSDSNVSLLTPSRHRDVVDTERTSPHLLSSRGSSDVCSPSKFFKSPLGTSIQTSKTLQRHNVVPIRLAKPKRLLEAIDSFCQQEKHKNVQTTDVEEASTAVKLGIEQESAEEKIQLPTKTNSQACTTASILDSDDIHCVPSGSLTTLNEHDSFFSFANSLSPLMVAEEFETSFMPMKLSPLVPRSYELPKLLPTFREQELCGNGGSRSIAHAYNNTPSIIQTPKHKPSGKREMSSTASLAISAPGSASGVVFSNFLAESFPNIQASTSATPGQDERLKLGSYSVMKLKLHTSFGPSPSLLDSHPTRKYQAINNSLKRKKYMRRRNTEDKRPQASSSSNVQRKLLQTPVKSPTSPRTVARSPLHPWNGQTSQASILTTATAQKLVPNQLTTKVAVDEASLSPPVTHRLVPATDPIPAPATPVGNIKKRKASQCVSMPASMTNVFEQKIRIVPLDVHQAVALAVTPAKQIKREVITTPDKYSILPSQMMLTCDASDMASFDSSMHQTPTRFASSTLLTMPLQSTPKPLLGATVMVMPSHVSKKAPCNCKKSKCLKLYCECFRLGGYCGKSCNCFDCANTTATEEVRQQAIASRLEKNPNAFKPKIGATPAAVALAKGGAHRLSVGASGGSHVSTGSLLSPLGQMSFQQQQQILSAGLATTKMHKHGCHCKKSACQKKYCECFQAGVSCGDNCRCIDCKNQTPCVAHENGVARAESALGGTPSRIANELDETFVSPVLHGTRRRMRIDRETWKKDFSSPFEASPERECDRTERLQSRLLASRRIGAGGTRVVRLVPFMSGSTPQVNNQSRSLEKMSPVRGQGEEQRGGSNEAAYSLQEHKLQQWPFADRIEKAASLAVVRSSAGAERVFVLPLFGAKLPPLENGVSAKIFCFLTNADLHNASLVSHLWNQVALGDTVWDHANFIPTRKNAAAGRCSRKKNQLETRMTLKPGKRNPMMVIKHEHNFAMLSTLR
ncbi:hypothetical protein DD237_003153 [Peronospora effusa]|uniref:CRC domain-containing protein n=1 Tax=Peronospora effusa TaxID=542832 RepID=A0A3R7XV63_9STRA|nr:hypothetical protein DD237_003153 [Peronospora effusa]